MKRLYSVALATMAVGAVVASSSVMGDLPIWQSNVIASPESTKHAVKAPTDNWEGPIIYGTVYYTVNDNPLEYGIYGIDGKTGAIAPVSLDHNVYANGGGVYEDGIYKFVGTNDNANLPIYYEFDPTDWHLIKSEVLPDWSNGGLDECYDPTTGNVYGAFFDEKGYSAYFGIIDHNSHKVTRIKQLQNIVYFAIFATPEGKVYTVASDGYLYEINKYNGDLTKIGHTGIQPKYNQTAVCDLKTGVAYWVGCDQSGTTGLYTIDLTTGKAKVVKTFKNRDGVVGAFIVQTPWSDHAPNAVDNLKANFQDASTSGTVTFTLPSKNVDNESISGSVNWQLHIDNKFIAKGEGAAGENVTVPVSLDKEGYMRFVVSTSNEQGTGKLADLRYFVGYDAPAAVKNLSLNFTGGNTVNIAWDAPTTSTHGGYLDPNDLSYRILRQPGGTVVSSSYKKNTFTQKLSTAKYAVYHYDVASQSHSLLSDYCSTGYVAVGPAQTIPWKASFSSQAEADLYVGLPGANNKSAWSFNEDDERFELAPKGDDAGSLLATPYLALDNAYAYKIDICAELTGIDKSTLAVKAGLTPDAAAFNVSASNLLEVEGESNKNYETYIYCPQSGNWHIGLDGSMLDEDAQLAVTEIFVSQGPKAASPAMVGNFQLVSGKNGANTVDVKFTAPNKTIAGASLSSLKKITILRDGKAIGAIDNPTPGASLTFTDSDAPLQYVDYKVVAENTVGEGIPTSGRIYVGIDTPTPPTNVVLRDMGECMRLSWSAPTQGVNGAYLDPENLTYIVLRSDNNVVARELKATTFDDTTDFSGEQRFVQYAVYAVSAVGNSNYTMSNAMIVGTPYEIPFHERFPGGSLDHRFWEGRGSSNSSFFLSNAQGADGLSGCATFKPSLANSESSLVSGKIDIQSEMTPVLYYSYKATCGADTRLEVFAEYGDNTQKVLDTVDFAELTGADGWRTSGVDLLPEQSHSYFRVGLRVKAGSDRVGSSIDELRIETGNKCDLAADLTIGHFVKCGQSLKALVRVDNLGFRTMNAGDYTVNLYKGGKIVASEKGRALYAWKSCDYEMELTADMFDGDKVAVFAEVVCADDDNSDNNRSKASYVTVKHSLLPMPEGFEGDMDANGNVELRWNDADLSKLTQTVVTDDCEAYEPFAINEVGEWTMHDGDGQNTYGISDGNGSYHAYKNALDPKAFIVFNEPKSGVAVADEFGRQGKWATHSGEQMFVSFQASGMENDDWLISPELSGKAQTVTFYVRSYGEATHGAETYELYYSTTDTHHESFIKLRSNLSAPDEWTLVELQLPEGATHFAIRCNSIGHFAFMVDDITYSPADFEGVQFLGFNLYRDRVKLNDAPLSATKFAEIVAGKSAAYHLSAVYDAGESRPVGPVAFGEAGIASVEKSHANVRSVAGGVVIEGADGMSCRVHTVDGVMVAYVAALGHNQFVAVESGLYLVTVGNTTHKVIVRN